MAMQQTSRITINQIDSSKPLDDWKPLLADFGHRRHLSYSLDFDARALTFEKPGDEWSEETQQIHLANQERTKAVLAREFGSEHLDQKIENFVAIRSKPLSVIAHHNWFFNQVRHAFVIGAYYPALVGACALGERILNHLTLELREFYKDRPEYKWVYRKNSFDNWDVPIKTLAAWKILLPKTVTEFQALAKLRNRSIHFNASTINTVREDALFAVLYMREIIDQQFTSFGDRPWFIPGTKGQVFIKREWEKDPFIRTYYLPTCPFVGPYFSISFNQRLCFHDFADYGDGVWTDEEFAAAYESRLPEQVFKVG